MIDKTYLDLCYTLSRLVVALDTQGYDHPLLREATAARWRETYDAVQSKRKEIESKTGRMPRVIFYHSGRGADTVMLDEPQVLADDGCRARCDLSDPESYLRPADRS